MARSTQKTQKKVNGKSAPKAKVVAKGKTKFISKPAAAPKNTKAPPKAKNIPKPKASSIKVSQKVTKIATKSKRPMKTAAPASPPKTATKPLQPIKPSKAPKAPKAPKPAKVSSGPKGYTPAEYAKFKEFKIKFEGFSNQGLKDLLRANFQSMSGNKDELIYKCADGATLGRIPRCPKCFGGRPKFDHQKGTYYCSGYRDDVDFKNCHSSFQLSEITRDAWTN
jgi:hypothetical protein